LDGSSKALATVTSVIDGTGSIGAAVGPFLAGSIGMDNVFYMLMASDLLALLVSANVFNGCRPDGKNTQ
jgi:OPA family glycerol-3-phosphate transporter-like MFS transporter 1/2